MAGLGRGTDGQKLEGSFVAIGNGPSTEIYGAVNFIVSGVFAATLRLEASFDQGATWIPVTGSPGVVRLFTAPERVVLDEVEAGVLYRVACTAFTSGEARWRFSR